MLGVFGPKSGKIGVYKGAFIYQGPFKEDFCAGSPATNEVVLGTSVNKGKRKGRTPKEPDTRLTLHYLRTDRRIVVKGASQPSWVFLSAYRSFFHARCA